MREFKNIVVGLALDSDGVAVTLGSQKAAQQAIWVAKANGGRIHFLHSTFANDYSTPVVGAAGGVVHEGVPEAGLAALESVVAEARNSGVEADLVISEDRPWMDITRMALRSQVDLVVVGKRNEKPEDGRRLGSESINLLRKCPTPVWVVRPEHDLVHRLVLAATDLSEVGDRASRYAGDVAERHECELHVVHAWQLPFELQMESPRMSEEEFSAEVDRLKQAAGDHIQSSLGEGRTAKLHLGRGTPSQVIREAVTHLDPDLLVMGTISRTGIAGLVLGSTAERMLGLVDCSILTVKPEGFQTTVEL
jgi:nucleotide-binding universal stress UspA family protein